MGESTIVTYHQPTSWGPNFRCTQRTADHLDWTKSELPKGATLQIIQPPYNTGFALSAGTHDKDAVLDVRITGMTWPQAQRFLRAHRWAAWVRTPAQGFSLHIHMVSVGCNLNMVGYLVPGQLADYRAHKTGLAGHAPDNTWHPDPILPFKSELLTRDTPRPKPPPKSPWESGKVYVERLRRRFEGEQIRDSDSIRRVQYRLLHHPNVPARAVEINGRWDAGTVSAVKYFQRMVFEAKHPENRDGLHLTNRQTNRLMGRNGQYEVIEE